MIGNDLPLTLYTLQTNSGMGNDVWDGWGSVILVVGLFVLATAIIIVLIWQGMAIWRAKSIAAEVAARDRVYRTLAEQATDVQQQVLSELTDLQKRVNSIERVLQEVD